MLLSKREGQSQIFEKISEVFEGCYVEIQARYPNDKLIDCLLSLIISPVRRDSSVTRARDDQ